MDEILRAERNMKLTVYLVGLGEQVVTVLDVAAGIVFLQMANGKKLTASTSAIVIAGPPYHPA